MTDFPDSLRRAEVERLVFGIDASE